jgi:cytochrome c oxidase assembly protein subunit 15
LPGQKATGGFLTGIGGVVLLAAWVWARNEKSAGVLPQLGWLALGLVQLQGLLGGLRVVLFKDQIGVFHATLAQVFFVLLCAIALLTSKWWTRMGNIEHGTSNAERRTELSGSRQLMLFLCTTLLILFQLMLGATMRHQHAGLAIRDFPLAYGKFWPATDAASIAQYNAHRVEITDFNPITAFQIELQMVHRIVAVLILCAVAFCAWRRFSWQNPISRLASFWLGLILCQVALGAATVLSDKAADIATAHVLIGALSLATGALISIIAFRNPEPVRQPAVLSRAEVSSSESGAFAARPT